MVSREEREIVLGKDMTLGEWLEAIRTPDVKRGYDVFPWNCFATDGHRTEYLASVGERSDAEIRDLLRRFLVRSAPYGVDRRVIDNLKRSGKALELKASCEYVRRLLTPGEVSWEGITWVLDVLYQPGMAIDALLAYLAAHAEWMTDQMINGLCDAMAIIRAAYIGARHPSAVLLGLDWRDFELLMGSLFRDIGFTVTVTQRSRDGGYDIEVARSIASQSERSVVECKRYSHNVGVKEVRALLGVVERRQAARGILVTTAGFTRSAKEEANPTGRLELIDCESLQELLNQHFGPDWPLRIDRYVATARRDFGDSGL